MAGYEGLPITGSFDGTEGAAQRRDYARRQRTAYLPDDFIRVFQQPGIRQFGGRLPGHLPPDDAAKLTPLELAIQAGFLQLLDEHGIFNACQRARCGVTKLGILRGDHLVDQQIEERFAEVLNADTEYRLVLTRRCSSRVRSLFESNDRCGLPGHRHAHVRVSRDDDQEPLHTLL